MQDLFFILTMLVLAQNWNLLAGYAGLISVGQQAFVGFGAYAMFGCVILFGIDPVLAILLAGLPRRCSPFPRPSSPFRLHGAYFAIGTWVVAEVVRLLLAQWKALGGGTGTSLPREATRDMIGADTDARALRHRRLRGAGDIADLLAGADPGRRHNRLHLSAAALASRVSASPPSATTSRRPAPSASMRGA